MDGGQLREGDLCGVGGGGECACVYEQEYTCDYVCRVQTMCVFLSM